MITEAHARERFKTPRITPAERAVLSLLNKGKRATYSAIGRVTGFNSERTRSAVVCRTMDKAKDLREISLRLKSAAGTCAAP